MPVRLSVRPSVQDQRNPRSALSACTFGKLPSQATTHRAKGTPYTLASGPGAGAARVLGHRHKHQARPQVPRQVPTYSTSCVCNGGGIAKEKKGGSKKLNINFKFNHHLGDCCIISFPGFLESWELRSDSCAEFCQEEIISRGRTFFFLTTQKPTENRAKSPEIRPLHLKISSMARSMGR